MQQQRFTAGCRAGIPPMLPSLRLEIVGGLLRRIILHLEPMLGREYAFEACTVRQGEAAVAVIFKNNFGFIKLGFNQVVVAVMYVDEQIRLYKKRFQKGILINPCRYLVYPGKHILQIKILISRFYHRQLFINTKTYTSC